MPPVSEPIVVPNPLDEKLAGGNSGSRVRFNAIDAESIVDRVFGYSIRLPQPGENCLLRLPSVL